MMHSTFINKLKSYSIYIFKRQESLYIYCARAREAKMAKKPTKTSDRECQPHTICKDTEHETKKPTKLREQEEKNNGESIIDISFYSIFLIYLIC